MTPVLVRREFVRAADSCGSSRETDTVRVPREFVERLTDAVCYAAGMAKVELQATR